MDLPLPSIFLAKKEDSKYLIVDGLQRLTALKAFIKSEAFNGKTFKLSNSKDINIKWRGKAFLELLLEDQRRIRTKLIHSIMIEPKTPSDLNGLYRIFERINTGGMRLNQQEIRNAIYQCPINNLLFELNDLPNWRNLFGKELPNNRMRDVEMILRFFALDAYKFEPLDKLAGSVSMVSLLNDFMEDNKKKNSQELMYLKDKFKGVLLMINNNFSSFIFRSLTGKKEDASEKFYATIYDALMIATSFAIEKNLTLLNNYKTNYINLLSSSSFKEYIEKHTTEKMSLFGRISLVCKALFGVTYEARVY